MAIYVFRAEDGSEIEVEASMEAAPAFGSRRIVKGKVYTRVIDTAPIYVPPNIRSKSHQLPLWYGFRNDKQADELARQRGTKATWRTRNLVGRINAEKAGALSDFDSYGRCRADSKAAVNRHIRRGRNLGDEIKWE